MIARWLPPAPRSRQQTDPEDTAGGPREPSPLDSEALERLEQVLEDPAAVAELVELMIEQTPRMLKQLREAIHELDAEAAFQIAHRIKGSAGTVGAVGIAGICGELEAAARAGELEAALRLSTRLDETFGRTRTLLEERTATRPEHG